MTTTTPVLTARQLVGLTNAEFQALARDVTASAQANGPLAVSPDRASWSAWLCRIAREQVRRACIRLTW